VSVTALDLQNLIIDSLSNADPTARTGLQLNIPRYWTLFNRQGTMIELQYYYTRREGIRYLMACLNRQIDYQRSANSASRNSTDSSRQDMTSSGNSLTTSASVSNRSMASQSVDETNSSGSGSSSMNRHNSQTMDDNSGSSDTGSGSNLGHQESLMASSSTTNGSTSDSTSSEQRSAREVTGFHRRMNESSKVSVGGELGFIVGLSGAITVMDTGELEDGEIMDSQTSQGTGVSDSKLSNNSSNLSDQSADQSSSSSFNANATSHGNMTASGISYMRASATSTSTMTGAGSGSMDSSGAGNSTMTSNSTRLANSTGEAHRLTVAASASNSTMEKLHQRFLHLQELWKKANEMIEWFEKQRLNLPAYTLQAIAIQFPDGLNADAANRYLVKTPFGLGLGIF
jgi:hypothetical protein